MNELEIKWVIRTLKNAIDGTEKMWRNEEQSHAFIIGYLQGTMKSVIEDLEVKANKNK
jgi:hypothetical protein